MRIHWINMKMMDGNFFENKWNYILQNKTREATQKHHTNGNFSVQGLY